MVKIVIADSRGCPDCGGPTTFTSMQSSWTEHTSECPRRDPDWYAKAVAAARKEEQ